MHLTQLSTCFLFTACLAYLQSWRWKQCVPPKRQWTSTTPHSIPKTVLFTETVCSAVNWCSTCLQQCYIWESHILASDISSFYSFKTASQENTQKVAGKCPELPWLDWSLGNAIFQSSFHQWYQQHNGKNTWDKGNTNIIESKKVKFSPLQALEALRVVRGWGSHIF
jgi:hypothetical protein